MRAHPTRTTTTAAAPRPRRRDDEVDRALVGAHLDPRAVEALRAIDWTRQRALLWVPGTNEEETPPAIAGALRATMPDLPVVRMRYEQSWRMRTSVPDGVRVLGDVLRGVRLLRARGLTRAELLVAGHSQGSWVIAAAFADAALAAQVRRAVLFSNPGTNPRRYPGPGPLTARGPVGDVLEVSNPRDPIAMTAHDVDAALDVVGGPGLLRRARGLVRTLAEDPGFALAIIARQAQILLHAYGPGEDPHLYGREALDGITFLRDGAPALARVGHGPAWADYAG